MSNRDAAGDLSAAADFIDFSQHGGVGSFQEILANAAQIDRDVVITIGADVLTLENAQLSDLSEGQFIV